MAEADEGFMRRALDCAEAALRDGDDPVGAVLVRDGRILAEGRNRVRSSGDITAHAEVDALRAALAGSNESPSGAVLYTTEEPCPMCLWMALRTGVSAIVIGARYADMPDEAVGDYSVEALLGLTGRQLPIRDRVLRLECLAMHDRGIAGDTD